MRKQTSIQRQRCRLIGSIWLHRMQKTVYWFGVKIKWDGLRMRKIDKTNSDRNRMSNSHEAIEFTWNLPKMTVYDFHTVMLLNDILKRTLDKQQRQFIWNWTNAKITLQMKKKTNCNDHAAQFICSHNLVGFSTLWCARADSNTNKIPARWLESVGDWVR